VETARRLGVPLLRAGFPQYDLLGGYQRLWVGYRGTRQSLFDLANLLVEHGHIEPEPYVSIYAMRTGDAAHFPHPNPPPEGEGANARSNFERVSRATPASGQTH
jgi:nitrogenase molybdenum-iron protein NifN